MVGTAARHGRVEAIGVLSKTRVWARICDGNMPGMELFIRGTKWVLALGLAWALWGTSWVARAEAPPPSKEIRIKVTAKGFEPSPIHVKKGEALTLKVTRTIERTCAKDFLMEGTPTKVELPLNQEVHIPFIPTKTGKIKFGCSMGMMISGVLLVE